MEFVHSVKMNTGQVLQTSTPGILQENRFFEHFFVVSQKQSFQNVTI